MPETKKNAELGRIDVHGATDAGRVRPSNQDQFLIASLKKSMSVARTSLQLLDENRLFGGSQGELLLVADGMGGHQAGADASTVAVDTVVNHVLNTMPWFFGLDASYVEDVTEQLQAAMERCNAVVTHVADQSDERAGMGTTLTMAYVLWPRLYVVHVGDSRAYLLRKRKLEQITKDHTVAQKMADEGVLEPKHVEKSPYSNVLWNAIGGDDKSVSPVVYKAELQIGDTLLLCTDGLTRHADDPTVLGILDESESAEAAVDSLIREANAGGGEDNVTAVVANFRRADGEAVSTQVDGERRVATGLEWPSSQTPTTKAPAETGTREPDATS